MPQVDFYVKKGDSATRLVATLADENGVFDLTGTTVTVNARNIDDNSLEISAASVTVTTPTAGLVTFDFAAGDVDTPGYYYLEFKIDKGGGAYLHFPRGRGRAAYMIMQIVDNLE